MRIGHNSQEITSFEREGDRIFAHSIPPHLKIFLALDSTL